MITQQLNRARAYALGLAGAALLALPVTSRAGGPLGVCGSGVPLVWPGGGVGIPWNADLGDLGPILHADAVAIVQSAFDVWGAVLTATPTYVQGVDLPVDVDINNFADYLSPAAPDGMSAVVFDHTGEIFDLLFGPGSGILGFAGPEWLDPGTCTVLEGVCFLNGPAFTDPIYALDVMVHEFGHYSGLAHTVVNGQMGLGDNSGPTPNDTFGGLPDPFANDIIETMYPFYFGPGIGTSSLEADDVAMLSTLYPEPGYLAGTGTIQGTILASNGTTPLTGINVIARNVADPFHDAVSAISGDFSAVGGDPYTGTYTLNGLTPGAEYAVYVDQILDGGFSTTPISVPGPEEFYSAPNETGLNATDDPSLYTAVTPLAGTPATGVDIILNAYEPGDALPVGDDGSIEVFLPFAFTICEQTFQSVWVNANGNVTFGGPDDSFSPSAPGFLDGPPRVAGLWTDLNPSAAGTVTFAQTPDVFSIVWDNVPEYPNVGAVNMTIKLYRTGNRVDVQYGAVSAANGIAGLSCGACGTSGIETPTDLSPAVARRSRMALWRQPAVFEAFDEFLGNGFDLAHKTALYQATVGYNDAWAGANNSLATAKLVVLPFNSAPTPKHTEIEPAGGDVDFFRFHLEAGDELTAEITRGCFDSLLGFFDSAGNLLAENDDIVLGENLLSKLRYQVPTAGEYVLAVSAFDDFGYTGIGGSGGRYVLDVKARFCLAPLPPGPDNWLVNGSFDTGDLTGWTGVDTGIPLQPWAVVDDTGSGFFSFVQPQAGCYAALNGFDGEGPMQSYLFQEVAIPAGEPFATLEWTDHLQWDMLNYTGSTVSRVYAVLLVDPTTFDLLEILHLVEAAPGTAVDTGWTPHSVDLSAYIGQTVMLYFYQEIPEALTGPGQFELDDVRLSTQSPP